MHSILFKSIEDLYRADISNYINKMANLTATPASTSEKCWEVFMCIPRLHSFCINEGCAIAINADEIQDNGPGFIPSAINQTSIVGNSVLQDITVQELSQQ